MLSEFMDQKNPFSAALEPELRGRFCKLNDQVNRAWLHTVMAVPGAVLAPLLTPFICEVGNLPPEAASWMMHVARVIPIVVVLFGLLTGLPAFVERRALLRFWRQDRTRSTEAGS